VTPQDTLTHETSFPIARWSVGAAQDTYPRELFSYSSLVGGCTSRHTYPRNLFSYSSLVGDTSRHLAAPEAMGHEQACALISGVEGSCRLIAEHMYEVVKLLALR